MNGPKVQGKGHQVGAAGLVQRVIPWRGPWPSGPSAASSLVGTWVVGRLAESWVLCMFLVSSNRGACLRACAQMEQHQVSCVKTVPPSMHPVPTQKGLPVPPHSALPSPLLGPSPESSQDPPPRLLCGEAAALIPVYVSLPSQPWTPEVSPGQTPHIPFFSTCPRGSREQQRSKPSPTSLKMLPISSQLTWGSGGMRSSSSAGDAAH